MDVNSRMANFGGYTFQKNQSGNANDSLKKTSNNQTGHDRVMTSEDVMAEDPSVVDDAVKQLEKLIKEKAMLEGFTVESNGIDFDSADDNSEVSSPKGAPKKGGNKKTLGQCIKEGIRNRSEMNKNYVQSNRDAAGPFFAGVIDGIINYFRQ